MIRKSHEGDSFAVTAVLAPDDCLHFTPHHWYHWLSEYIPELGQDTEKAAILLCGLMFGVEITYRYRAKPKTSPRLGIADESPFQKSVVVYNDANHIILIKRSYLLQIARLKIELQTEIRRSTGELYFIGYLTDLMFLIGAEEADHSLFDDREALRYPDPLSVSQDEADATNVEFHALVWVLQLARQRRMPYSTISLLEDRVGKAKAVRILQGLSLDI